MGKTLTVPTIFSAVDKFSGPVGKMSKNANTAFAKMDRKLRKVGDTAFDISKKSAMVGLTVAAPMALLANEAVKFEEKMSNVSTLIDTNTESMEEMGDKVLAMSKKLPVPIDELTTSLYDVRSAGITAEMAMETLESSAKLAVGGLGSVQEATNITTSALNAFASEGLSAHESANILIKGVRAGKTTVADLSTAFGANASTIQSAGVQLDDFVAATAALTTSGMPAAQAQNRLRATITALQKPTSQMKKVFKELGVATDKEMIQKFGGLKGSMEAIVSTSEKLNLNVADVVSSSEAFGAVMSLTGEQNKAYKDTLDLMRDGTNALDDAFEKQSKTAKGTMQIAKNNFQSLAITLGNVLIPMINDLMSVVTPMIERFASWISANKPLVKTIMKVAAGVAAFAFAVSGISGVVGIATKVVAAFNFVLALNPAILIAAGIVALGAAVYALSGQFSSLTRSERLNNEVKERALENTIDERVEVTLLFKALKKAKIGSDEYNSTLQKLEQIQPGIIKQYNLQAGALEDINRAEKALIASIIKRGEAEARVELIKEKTKEKMQIAEQDLGTIESLQAKSLGFTEAQWKAMKVGVLEADINQLAEQQAESQLKDPTVGAKLKAVNPKIGEMNRFSQIVKESKESVEVTIKNESGSNIDVSGSAGANINQPSMGKTNGK